MKVCNTLKSKEVCNRAVADKPTYSRVLNITVCLNKSVGANVSWKLIKKLYQIRVQEGNFLEN